MTKELSRTSALASRHHDLGSSLEDWNGMGTAWTYNSNANDEHDAIREAAGLIDMSGLKKVYIRGVDSSSVVDHIITRNMLNINVGQSCYGTILTEKGKVCDDAIIYNNGNNEWLLVHGSGESMERLQESAVGEEVEIQFDDDLHDLSLQGPKALDFLNQRTPIDLSILKYFHHQPTEIFGHKCIISRTGYSGERGYEIFAAVDVIGDIWDNIVGQGKDLGFMPCSFSSLDKVRVEAGLLFYGYDMTTEHTPWEVGLGWTISRNKNDFRGEKAVYASEGKERFKMVGLEINQAEALSGNEKLKKDNEEVGVVNSPVWSHRMKKSLALAHIRPDLIEIGTEIDISSDSINCSATVRQTPFYDPQKTKTRQ